MKQKGATGELEGKTIPLINDDLKRREMDTPGVIHAVYDGWNRFEQSENSYEEIVSRNTLRYGRSDLTDEYSMRLYSSFFDRDRVLSSNEIYHMSGVSKANPGKGPLHHYRNEEYKEEESEFVRKARAFNIIKHVQLSRVQSSLFGINNDTDIPIGFEQINESLFARKENRFMVFNLVSIQSNPWPPRAKTKLYGLDEDIDFLRLSQKDGK